MALALGCLVVVGVVFVRLGQSWWQAAIAAAAVLFAQAAFLGHNHPDRTSPVPQHARPNLRRAQALVRQFCSEHGIAHHETTLAQSWAQAPGCVCGP
ncbi:hypothetical protein OOK41_15095 [Micromonospora sp. NBC_01655]|uniref:hypothetical protein n=1 Tax=Micromonospora sp. NBC_01655 TaxID=2975983 RepID=UPI00225C38E5|nr:hypothetical protein [Micromonospora sp. NBC_01655]MCX4471611.1 hypothetical protein [Micromonospora sp. NBC_01655]